MRANTMTTRHHVIRIIRKEGLFDEVIGITFGEVRDRFIESKFYNIYRGGYHSDTTELIQAFMEQNIPGEYDPQEFADLEHWIRHEI